MNEQTKPETIGQAITADRLARGMSISDLGRAVEIPTQSLSRWEAGGSEPRSLRLSQLVKFFGPDSWTASMAPANLVATVNTSQTPDAGLTNKKFLSDEERADMRANWMMRRRDDARTRALYDHTLHSIGAIATPVYNLFLKDLQRERLLRAAGAAATESLRAPKEIYAAQYAALQAAEEHEKSAEKLAKALVDVVIAEGQLD